MTRNLRKRWSPVIPMPGRPLKQGGEQTSRVAKDQFQPVANPIPDPYAGIVWCSAGTSQVLRVRLGTFTRFEVTKEPTDSGGLLKTKGKNASSPTKALSSKSSELRGWPAIAKFLGMPNSTARRWAKEGMPLRREGRNVVANPEGLNQWLQRTSGEGVGVHIVTPGSDLMKDLRASVAVEKEANDLSPGSKSQRVRPSVLKARRPRTS